MIMLSLAFLKTAISVSMRSNCISFQLGRYVWKKFVAWHNLLCRYLLRQSSNPYLRYACMCGKPVCLFLESYVWFFSLEN